MARAADTNALRECVPWCLHPQSVSHTPAHRLIWKIQNGHRMNACANDTCVCAQTATLFVLDDALQQPR